MMAGLIDTEISKTDPLSSVSGYNATKIELDPTKDTVAGQVDSVIKNDSPLMQGARTRASQAANSRGLLNSTMAVQAGEEAVHNAALPIAQQDAQTNFQTKQLNQNAENQATQFTAGAKTQGALQESGAQNERSLTTLRGEIETGLQTLRGTQAVDLAEIEASYKTLMQSNDSATKVYQQTMDAINKILTNNEMDAASKQSAIDKQNQMLKSALSITGKISNLDLTSILDFSGADLVSTATPAAAAPASESPNYDGDPAYAWRNRYRDDD